MLDFKVRPSTIQVVGTSISISLGLVGGYITRSTSNAAANGIIIALLAEVLTFVVDIYYGPLGESKLFYDALRRSPVLKYYEDCIVSYTRLKDEYKRSGEIGRLLDGWLDDRVKRHYLEAESEWRNGKIRFPQDEVAMRSVQVLKCVRYSGFATQLERSTTFWDLAEDYLEDSRELARAGRNITRVFILNSKDSLQNTALRDQITRDRQAGITPLVTYVNRISLDAIQDFGIWDDRLLCVIALTPVGGLVTGSIYSIREEDLEEAKKWKNEILRQAAKPELNVNL